MVYPNLQGNTRPECVGLGRPTRLYSTHKRCGFYAHYCKGSVINRFLIILVSVIFLTLAVVSIHSVVQHHSAQRVTVPERTIQLTPDELRDAKATHLTFQKVANDANAARANVIRENLALKAKNLDKQGVKGDEKQRELNVEAARLNKELGRVVIVHF